MNEKVNNGKSVQYHDRTKLKVPCERIAILDYGAQYGKVIDRRIREMNVMSEILPFSTTADDLISRGGYKAIVISGGPHSVFAADAPPYDASLFSCGLPILGICYGFQLINKTFGGNVTREAVREDGQMNIDIDISCPLFTELNTRETVMLTHGDSVLENTVANDLNIIARSGNLISGIAHKVLPIYGLQFHPEVDLTINGKKMLYNFLFRIAKLSGDFSMGSREQLCIDEIQAIVGDKKVLVLVSGGVDSTVCAALLHKAIGADKIVAIHIDNGFMRYNESENVVKALNGLNLNVHDYYCGREFFNGKISINGVESLPLSRVCQPELKRRIIGDTFMQIKDRIMKLEKDIFLAQGTLRPDLIESASSVASSIAAVIKTHHNDTALVRELRNLGKVIEPLKDFHKDEVRELGLSLGLQKELVQRHPFPGPGLSIRLLCAEQPYVDDIESFLVTQHHLKVIANLPHVDEDLNILTNHLFEIGTTLLPIQSVGVQGDDRSYSYVAALSTSHRPVPWQFLEYLAQLIPRLLHNINRYLVVYVFGDIVEYPISDVTRTFLNPFTVSFLRWADRLVYDVLCGLDENQHPDPSLENCVDKIQQMPVVMIPIHFDRDPCERKQSTLRSFVLRPFITRDFMTGVAALPGRDIPEKTVMEMVSRLSRIPLTSRVMIDLTSKPPGTTEWE
ncbi:unnamed protein product [Dracunculus medinensis]|uniref:GMP synthase (glutamine-hydrolyzing) n=1 Tax=Dracunculus medinensis TaxID=318479 RepID=A0A0N4UGI7_DRAME|nr:unnamed protein product [Dracunculus medinensis]